MTTKITPTDDLAIEWKNLELTATGQMHSRLQGSIMVLPELRARDAEIVRLQGDLEEQCRINGIGGSKELCLVTQLNEALEVMRQFKEAVLDYDDWICSSIEDAAIKAHDFLAKIGKE